MSNRAHSTSNGSDWLATYTRLAEAMEEIRRRCPRLVALGISTLSPRHPLPPDQLRLMAGAALARPSSIEMLGRWIWCVGFALRDTLRLAWARVRSAGAVARIAKRHAAVVLKTWGFGPGSITGASDFYYGTLQEQLRERGVDALLLCGDARGVFDPAFARAVLRHPGGAAYPESLVIPLWAPLATAVSQWPVAWALRGIARRHDDATVRSVAAAACRGSLEPIAMRNALQFHIARAAVRRWRARVFVTFYEGQPWELPAWRGAKAADPRCVTVGYQHTILMPYSLSLLAPSGRAAEHTAPEVVLCVGHVTRAMMAGGHASRGNRLLTFGSFRRTQASAGAAAPRPERRAVLVLPEGNLPESRVLFNFAMRAAAAMPEHRFIFRCHPLLPFERVRAQLDENPDRLANVELSPHPSIVDDFARCSVVLYRGSSAVLYAVLRGLKPVYLHDARHPDIDPLFELAEWRDHVDSVEAFASIARGYAGSVASEAQTRWRPAAEYVDRYTVPVDARSIEQFVEAAGLAGEPRG